MIAMKILLFGLIPLALIALNAPPMRAQPLPSHFANLKQLTNGGSNGESYWSPDSKRIIFQSTRDGRTCDQEYIMNADGSDQHMVSTGKGVTTCGYFTSDNKHIIYASTHAAGAACPAPPDRSKGYVWSIYPSFDIYLATDKGEIVQKLTDAPGYDAEGTVNFKTKRILYTSMASGDLELWTMKEDGSGKTRITDTEGYDGGAVASRDGKMMVWRAYHPDTPAKIEKYRELLKENLTTPMKMELFVKRVGSSVAASQITDFGCASFAPTFTPDGQQILFASNKNKCDSGQFDLFLINIDGTGLEQVTNWGKFTSFPEFSPDGKKLIFSSSFQSKGNYEFNIFSVDWKP
jgi:Tol biopolymer transport system component